MMDCKVYSILEDGSDMRLEFIIDENDPLGKTHLSGLGWTPDNKLMVVVPKMKKLVVRDKSDYINKTFTY